MGCGETKNSVRYLYTKCEEPVWYDVSAGENYAELKIQAGRTRDFGYLPRLTMDKMCFLWGLRGRYGGLEEVRVVSDSRKAIKCMKRELGRLEDWDPRDGRPPAIRGRYWDNLPPDARNEVFAAFKDVVSGGNVKYKKTRPRLGKLLNYFRVK